jgi:Uma2 family endonuclease
LTKRQSSTAANTPGYLPLFKSNFRMLHILIADGETKLLKSWYIYKGFSKVMQTLTIDRTKKWTVEDYLLLGETNTRCELINGDLIMSPSPSPYHQDVVSNLYDSFKKVARKLEGKVYFSPIDLYIDNTNVYQPDLLFLPKESLRFVTNRGIEGPPDVVIEVISPSNAVYDRNTKKRRYLNFGVKEYWIVDPGKKTVEIYLRDHHSTDVPYLYLVEEGQVTSTILADLCLDLKDIFNP